eukprot:7331696-Pyramimonas_sp.AAC.1
MHHRCHCQGATDWRTNNKTTNNDRVPKISAASGRSNKYHYHGQVWDRAEGELKSGARGSTELSETPGGLRRHLSRLLEDQDNQTRENMSNPDPHDSRINRGLLDGVR